MPRLVAFYLREFSGRADGEVSWLYKFIFCLCLPFVSNTFYRARLIALAIAECTESVAQIDRVLDMITASDSSGGATISIERTNEDYLTVFGESATPVAPATFFVTPEYVNALVTGGPFTIQVTGPTGGWSVSATDTSWAQVSVASPTTASLVVMPNSGASQRSQVITFTWVNPADNVTHTARVNLTQAANTATAQGSIRGFVQQAATGAPVFYAEVQLIRSNDGLPFGEYQWSQPSDGTYLLHSLSIPQNVWEEGSWQLRVREQQSDTYSYFPVTGTYKDLISTHGIRRDIALGREGEAYDIHVGIRVVDGVTKTDPISGAAVTFNLGPNGVVQGTSDSVGLVQGTIRMTEAYWNANKDSSLLTVNATGYRPFSVTGSGRTYSFSNLITYGLQLGANLIPE